MLEAALKEILRELAAAAGASRVALVPPGPALVGAPGSGDDDAPCRDVPLGGGARLCVYDPHPGAELELAQLLEQAARAIRGAARRYEAPALPGIAWPDPAAAPRDKVLERIRAYLRALLSCQGMINAAVSRHGRVIACAEPVSEEQRARLSFAARRVDAEADRRDGTSHAEVADDDCFAASFYYDAHLVAFFDGPYATDFVRHRVRLVTRELAELLPLLDGGPDDPVQAAPRPE